MGIAWCLSLLRGKREEKRRKLGVGFLRRLNKGNEKMAKTKILIAEDEAITARDLQDRLKDLGYDAPAIASSGEEAIKMAEELKPDLVLMDIRLNGMDGIDAAVHIHDRFDIPVIYLTAYIDEERLERTRDTEPLGYIIKPFKANELRPAIEMALQRHKLEKSLRDSEAKYRELAENIHDLLLQIDIQGNITYMSKSIEYETGYTCEEIVGKRIQEILTQESYKAARERISKWMAGVKSLPPYEVEVKTKDGGIIPFELNTSPIFEGGKLKAIQIIARNICERKKREEELKKKNEKLKRFNKLAVGRELRMVELKNEINALLEQLGEKTRY